MPKVDHDPDRKTLVANAWRNWVLAFVPSFAIAMSAAHWLGFNLVIPFLLVLLVTQLLYQRLVNGRTWDSILWGVHSSRE
jgi:hypothetical protein